MWRALAVVVALAGIAACDRGDRNDPAAVPAAEQRKAEDTAYRLEAEANQIANEIDALDNRIEEVSKHAPTAASPLAEVDEYKQQLDHLNAEKTALMMRIDTLQRAVEAERRAQGSGARP